MSLQANHLEPKDQPLVNELAARWHFGDALQHALASRTGPNNKPAGPMGFFHSLTSERINANKLEWTRPRATHVPWDLLESRSGANAMVQVSNRPDAFTSILSDAAILPELGALELRDLNGKARIPRQTSTTAASWADNSTDNTHSDDGLEVSELESKTLYITRKSERSAFDGGPTSRPIAQLLEKDLAAQAGNALLSAALNGDGSTGTPRGLIPLASDSGTDVATVSLPTSGVPTFADLIEIERKHADSRALTDRSAWIVSPTMLESLRAINTGGGLPVLTPHETGNRLLGYRVKATTSCPANTLLFGDWSKLALLYWLPGVDLVVNPFTAAPAIETTLLLYCNLTFLQPSAFVVAS